MSQNDYTAGEQPWVRRHPEKMPCPYCGSGKLIISITDRQEDALRPDLYCDNGDCDIRVFTIIPMRIEGPPRRADVRALMEIDRGTPEERLPNEVNIMDPAMRAAMKLDLESVVERRQRPVKVTVEPVENWWS